MFGFLKRLYKPANYALRPYPGPGVDNAAYLPGNEDPLFSPLGTGIASTYPWQLTGRGDYQLRGLVYAGQVQGYKTGAFIPGSPLLPEPITFGDPQAYATDLTGSAG